MNNDTRLIVALLAFFILVELNDIRRDVRDGKFDIKKSSTLIELIELELMVLALIILKVGIR